MSYSRFDRFVRGAATACLILLISLNRAWGSAPSKPPQAPPVAEWSDVLLVDKPEPVVSYRTGWVVYEESLTKGQFVGRGWNGSGSKPEAGAGFCLAKSALV